jgi:acyl-coenzyme A synthetase/AMP-(fatty) acid ligase
MAEPHAAMMARALAAAPARGGWIALPELRADYRGPVDLPFEAFGHGPVLELLAVQVAERPDAVAIADIEGSLSYRALWQATGRLAARLRTEGGAGPVGVLVPARAAAAVAVFACLAAGRPSLLLDAAHAPARNAALLARAGATRVLGPGAAAGLGRLPFTPLEAAFDPGAPFAEPDASALGEDAPAFILCTSGSSGEPKLLAYSQRGTLQQTRMLVDSLHLSSRDRLLTLTSGTAIPGLLTLFVPLAGCTLDIFPLGELGLREVATRLRSHGATVLRAGPSLLRAIAHLPDATEALSGLRAIRLGSEAVLRSDAATWWPLLPPGCVLHNRYGATELLGAWWVMRPEDDHDPVRVAAGLPDPGVEFRIVDEAGRDCAPGEAGEIWLRGRHAALGEVRPGGLHLGRLDADPEEPGLRIHRTGDLARLAPDGAIVVLGRRDRMVKVNGQRVEPAEVEAALRRSPEVREAAVVARESEGRVTLRAFVVVAPDAPAGVETRLRQALRGTLPPAMQPARIEVLGALPLLPNGKLDERALLDRG